MPTRSGVSRRASDLALMQTPSWDGFDGSSRMSESGHSSGRGPWPIARSKALSFGLSNVYFKSLGLPSLFGAC